MPEEFKAGCQRPEIKRPAKQSDVTTQAIDKKEEMRPMIKVGKPAPDFSASAFYKGKFVNVSLSEYRGKWVVLCFYPGDFTFV